MSAYEILKRLNKYALFIEHMKNQDYICLCTEDTTCQACHARSLYEELDEILQKAGRYVF